MENVHENIHNFLDKCYLSAIFSFASTQSISRQDYARPFSKWEPGLNCTEYVTDRMWFVSSFLKKIWQLILMKSRTSAFTFLDIHVIFKFRLVIRSSNALETCPHTPINCSKLSISYKYIQKAFEWKLNLNKTLKIIFST